MGPKGPTYLQSYLKFLLIVGPQGPLVVNIGPQRPKIYFKRLKLILEIVGP